MPVIYLSPYYSMLDYALALEGVYGFRHFDRYGGSQALYNFYRAYEPAGVPIGVASSSLDITSNGLGYGGAEAAYNFLCAYEPAGVPIGDADGVYQYRVYQSDTDISNIAALYTTASTNIKYLDGDQYYSNVAILLHGEGSDGGAVISNEKPLAVTNSGVVTSTTQKKFGTSSLYFNGTNAYFNIAQAWNNNTTMEMWVYPTAYNPSNSWLVETANGGYESGVGINASGKLFLYIYGNPDTSGDSGLDVPLNQWSHIAVNCVDGAWKLYVNGVFGRSHNVSGFGSMMAFGRSTRTGGYFQGYIDDLRFTVGTARYQTDFNIPSTTFLNTGPNGEYVLGGNSPVDFDKVFRNINETQANGDAAVPSFAPNISIMMGQGAEANSHMGYYLYDSANATATLSPGWVEGNQLASTGILNTRNLSEQEADSDNITQLYVATASVSGLAIEADSRMWYYLYDGSLARATGVLVAPPIGSPVWSGDEYIDNVSLLMHMEGTNGGTTFTDVKGHSLVTNGTTTTSSTQKKFGNTSANFTGGGSITVADDAAFNLGYNGQKFTLECFCYYTDAATAGTIIGRGGNGNSWGVTNGFMWSLQVANSNVYFHYLQGTSAVSVSAPAPAANAWHHLAVTYDLTTLRIFVDGASITSVAPGTFSKPATSNILKIGGNSGGELLYTGYIDDLRITNGIARYTSNFSVQDMAFADSIGTAQYFTSAQEANSHMGYYLVDGSTARATPMPGFAPPNEFGASGIPGPNKVEDEVIVANITQLYATTVSTAVAPVKAANQLEGLTLSKGSNTVTINTPGKDYLTTPIQYGRHYFEVYSSDGNGRVGITATPSDVGAWYYNQGYHFSMASQGVIYCVLVDFDNGEIRFGQGSLSSTLPITVGPVYYICLAGIMQSPGGTYYAAARFNQASWTYYNTLGIKLYGSPGGTVDGTAKDLYPLTIKVEDEASLTNITQLYVVPGETTPAITTLSVVGGDTYIQNVAALFHFDGTNGSTTFTDVKGHSATGTGSPTISTTQSKFGGSSLAFNGTNNLVLASSVDYAFGTGDFTIELWMYPTTVAVSNYIFGSDSIQNIRMTIGSNNNVLSYFGNTTLPVSLNSWNHIAMSRVAGTLRLFVNGVIGLTIADSTNIAASAWYIGSAYDQVNSNRWVGYVDDLRFTKGTGRYTDAFVVPSAAFPNSAGAVYTTWDTTTLAAGAVLSNSNLTVTTSTASQNGARSAVGLSSGKPYWEIKYDQNVSGSYAPNGTLMPGVGSAAAAAVNGYYNHAEGCGYYAYQGNVYAGGSVLTTLSAFAPGDTIGFAFDIAARSLTIYKNGVSQGQVTVPTVAGGVYYVISGDGTSSDSMRCTANFGATPFTYPVPNGYTAGFVDTTSSKIFAGLVPLSGTGTISGLTVSAGSAYSVLSDISSSNFYYEVTHQSSYTTMGLGSPTSGSLWADSLYVDSPGNVYLVNTGLGVSINGGSAISAGSVVGFAWDGSIVKIYLNGVLKFTSTAGQLAAGTKKAYLYSNGGTLTSNFGATAFAYTVPLGYDAGISTTTTDAGDTNFSSVTTLLHFDGANGSSTITDVKGQAITVSGITNNTSIYKFGTASGYGSNGAMQIPSDSLTGDFTMETWVYLTANGYNAIFGGPTTSTWVFYYGYSGQAVRIWDAAPSTAVHVWNNSVTLNAWHHVALVRSGSTITAYVDGASTVSYTDASTYLLGNTVIGQSYPLNGYIDEYRITKGVARYTSNFTVPSAAFLDGASTSILVTYPGAGGASDPAMAAKIEDEASLTNIHMDYVSTVSSARELYWGGNIFEGATLNGGGLTTTTAGGWTYLYSTLAFTSQVGVGYYEFVSGGGSIMYGFIGVSRSTPYNGSYPMWNGSWSYPGNNLSVVGNGTQEWTYYINNYETPTAGWVYGCSYNYQTGEMKFYRNGILQMTCTGQAGVLVKPAISTASSNCTMRFNRASWSYNPENISIGQGAVISGDGTGIGNLPIKVENEVAIGSIYQLYVPTVSTAVAPVKAGTSPLEGTLLQNGTTTTTMSSGNWCANWNTTGTSTGNGQGLCYYEMISSSPSSTIFGFTNGNGYPGNGSTQLTNYSNATSDGSWPVQYGSTASSQSATDFCIYPDTFQSIAAGEVYGVMLDIPNRTIKFYRNTTLIYTYTNIPTGKTWRPCCSAVNAIYTMRFNIDTLTNASAFGYLTNGSSPGGVVTGYGTGVANLPSVEETETDVSHLTVDFANVFPNTVLAAGFNRTSTVEDEINISHIEFNYLPTVSTAVAPYIAPSNNNPLEGAYWIDGGLTATKITGWYANWVDNRTVTSGKAYFELVKSSGTTTWIFGFTTGNGYPSNGSSRTTNYSPATWLTPSNTPLNGNATAIGDYVVYPDIFLSTNNGDVHGCYLDLDAKTLTFYKNGSSWLRYFNLPAGQTWKPCVNTYTDTVIVGRFNESSWTMSGASGIALGSLSPGSPGGVVTGFATNVDTDLESPKFVTGAITLGDPSLSISIVTAPAAYVSDDTPWGSSLDVGINGTLGSYTYRVPKTDQDATNLIAAALNTVGTGDLAQQAPVPENCAETNNYAGRAHTETSILITENVARIYNLTTLLDFDGKFEQVASVNTTDYFIPWNYNYETTLYPLNPQGANGLSNTTNFSVV